MQEVFNRYISYLEAERRVSPYTVRNYKTDLLDFFYFLRKKGKNSLQEVDRHAVRDYMGQLVKQGIVKASIARKLSAIRSFYRYLLREKIISTNPVEEASSPKLDKRLPSFLTLGEVERLLKAPDLSTPQGQRDRALLELLYASGLRVSELCSLKYEDAHIEEGYLKVFGKGSKERIVPIGALSQKMLWRYVIHFRPEPLTPSDDYLFLTLDGKPLVVNAVKLLSNRWGKKAGVPRLHAHLCRHTYATNFLCHNCGDVFRLQQILGHTTLEMVRKYVHYASAQTLMNGRIASPVDHMGIRNLRNYKIDRELRNNRHQG